MDKLNYIDRFARRISAHQTFGSIRKGLLHIMPLVLIGSFVLMLLNLPIPQFQNLMLSLFGEHWRNVALSIYNGTFQIMALTALMSISYVLAETQDVVRSGEVSPICVVLTSFASYIAFTSEADEVIRLQDSSSTGMFGAIVIAVLSTRLFLLLYRLRAKRLQVYAYDADAILVNSLRMVLPALGTVLVFVLAKLFIDISGLGHLLLTWYASMCEMVIRGGGNLLTAILFTFVSHILWFFGLHGTNILDKVAADLFVSASEANVLLAQAGEAPAHILTKEFFDNFVYLGGCGCTLGLLIALLVAGRSSNVNRIARYSLLPGIFNINEMMVYGLPIIFSPYYLVPFLLTPSVLCCVTYGAMRLGLVPLTTSRVLWTTPIFVSGYVSTGSVSAIVLQVVNLAIAALMYIPFIRLYEKNLASDTKNIYKKLFDAIRLEANQPNKTTMHRSDEVGFFARALASELEENFRGDAKKLHLEYQPKVNAQGTVVGAEALLRWKHPIYGFISPLVVVGICEESGMGNHLGSWVFNQALDDFGHWQSLGLQDIHISINLSPRQLKDDNKLIEVINSGFARTGVDPRLVELELTEEAAVDQSESTREKLRLLKETGANIAIDDFGMGNSSLLYLRDLYANVVKLDISLVRTITENKHSQGIVKSIIQLCQQLEVGLIAEGVETKEQMELLRDMGCYHYQGYYFSRALPPEEFLGFIANQKEQQYNEQT